MATVEGTTQVQTTNTITHGDTLDDSVAAVLTMLSGKKISVTDLTKMKISEDVLYASLVYDSLSQEASGIAKTFKEELKTRFDRRTGRNDSQPLAKAINDILDNAVKAKKLTQKQSDLIVKDAFGHAQLDTRKGALSRTAKPGGFETFEKAVANNSDATYKTATKFEGLMDTSSFLLPSTARRQKKEFDKIVKSLSEKMTTDTKEPTKTESEKTEPGKPTGQSETKIPSLLDNQNPYQLVYDPASEKDGNVLVAIPVNYARDVKGVSLIDEDGKPVATLKHSGVTKDGRRNFRADASGEKLKAANMMRIYFADGTDLDLLIGGGDKPFVKQYAQ